MSQNLWSPEFIQACLEKTKLPFLNDPEIITEASKDFGALFKGSPSAVVFPQTVADFQSLFAFANKNKLTFTLRSKGYSQGGQTLAPQGTVTLDCSQMTKVDKPNLDALTVKCESGATWSTVLAVTSPHNMVPKVIPFFPGLTVGGVLSIGGVGGNSHLYGNIGGNVKELEVVTGLGEHKRCNAEQNASLFEATLCGLGRCGVITSATIALRKYKPQVKTFFLHYDNQEDWLTDQKILGCSTNCDYLEAFCFPAPIGFTPDPNGWKPLIHWLYTIQASFEYDKEEPTETLLSALNYQKLISSQISPTLSYLTRYTARIEHMKKSGSWELAHPWWECFLPIDLVSQILPHLLQQLPLSLGDGLGYRLLVLNEKGLTSFMKPSSSTCIAFAALPIGINTHSLQPVLDSLKIVDEWVLARGGKRYLSGWLGNMDQEAWKLHYGSYYYEWMGLKEKYDPNGILQSLLLKDAD